MNKALEASIWARAGAKCEYCHLPHAYTCTEFEIDHIIPQKHGGKTIFSNLAIACFYRNSFKGPNLSGIDPVTREIVSLFHPRRHKWSAHFVWNGPRSVGKSPRGRATIAVFRINHPEAIAARKALIAKGVFP